MLDWMLLGRIRRVPAGLRVSGVRRFVVSWFVATGQYLLNSINVHGSNVRCYCRSGAAEELRAILSRSAASDGGSDGTSISIGLGLGVILTEGAEVCPARVLAGFPVSSTAGVLGGADLTGRALKGSGSSRSARR